MVLMAQRSSKERVTGSPARHVFYWDIDGTLLTTARAGVPALEDAFEAVLSHRPDLSGMRTTGLTDGMIARAVLTGLGHASDPRLELELLRAYTDALPGRLEQRRGRVLPGVLETLTDLAAQGDIANVLLTGNARAGAKAKLRSYELWHFFSTGGFAEDGHDRVDIARAAVRRARQLHGPAADEGILLGDTPFDIDAGVRADLRVVAVASDAHPYAELAALHPWWVVDQVPSAAALLARLDETDSAVAFAGSG